jgi:hypothetical protein
MKTPSQIYIHSNRSFPSQLAPLEYPLHDDCARVTDCGHFKLNRVGTIYLGLAFAGQRVGLREIETGTWLVSFMNLDIGYLDSESRRIINLTE